MDKDERTWVIWKGGANTTVVEHRQSWLTIRWGLRWRYKDVFLKTLLPRRKRSPSHN